MSEVRKSTSKMGDHHLENGTMNKVTNTKAHSNNTKTFEELTYAQEASSISAQILSLEKSMLAHIKSAKEDKEKKRNVEDLKNNLIQQVKGMLERFEKKVILLVSLWLFFMSISIYAQTLIPQENSKSKWGYVNETGKVIIKHKYDEARAFSEELAVVKVTKSTSYGGNVTYIHKYGVIDKTGKAIIPLEYDEIGNFSEGLIKVKKGGRWGFVDKTGKVIIPPLHFDEIGDFSEGLAKAKRGGRWGFIDKTGEIVIGCNYIEVSEFSEGLARACRSAKYNSGYYDCGFIDKTGKVIIPLEYDDVTNFVSGFAGLIVSGFAGLKYRDKWGIINKRGEVVLPVEYEEKEVKKMLSDQTLMQKEIQRIQEESQKEIRRKQEEESRKEQEKQQKIKEEKMLIEEVEAALDNDFYSSDCPPVEVLEKLRTQLEQQREQLKKLQGTPEFFTVMEKATYLAKLQTSLSNAITTQVMTKKHGVATAKKIMAGKYEIGMSKEIVEEIIGAKIFYYKKSVSTMAGKKSEIWEFDYNAEPLRIFDLKTKNNLKSECPTFVFRDGKLTDIIR